MNWLWEHSSNTVPAVPTVRRVFLRFIESLTREVFLGVCTPAVRFVCFFVLESQNNRVFQPRTCCETKRLLIIADLIVNGSSVQFGLLTDWVVGDT